MLAIEALKAFERKEAVYLVMDDPEMKRLILAWTVYGSVQSPKPAQASSKDFNAVVADAWSGCAQIDINRVSSMAELSPGNASAKMEILVRHGLIYPDGTANENAMLVIRANVRAGLQTLSGKTRTNQKETQ
jgi:hypothetical protein